MRPTFSNYDKNCWKPQSRQSAKLFLQSSELGLPQPLKRRRVCPLPPGSGGEGHTRWRERGWESPNSDEGTYTVVLFMYTYFVLETILMHGWFRMSYLILVSNHVEINMFVEGKADGSSKAFLICFFCLVSCQLFNKILKVVNTCIEFLKGTQA
jgi:hypothetical protein